jgi:hypothetical protein
VLHYLLLGVWWVVVFEILFQAFDPEVAFVAHYDVAYPDANDDSDEHCGTYIHDGTPYLSQKIAKL